MAFRVRRRDGQKPDPGAAVTAAVDTSEQIAAYGALTLIRYTPAVVNDENAVKSCDYLRTVCTAWPANVPATTPSATKN